MVEIAKSDQEKGILQKDISEIQNISYKYLDQIIHSLKRAGLLVNVKGKKSGYQLTRLASEITLYQIHAAFEPEIAIVDCLSGYIQCDMEDICTTKDFWSGLNNIIEQYLTNITLQDLVNGEEINYNLIKS